MPIQNIERKSTNITKTTFQKTSIIPTYAIAITLFRSSDFPYFVFTMNNTWYHMRRLLPYMKFAGNLVNDVMWHLKSKLKDFEIVETIKHIAIPGFLYESTDLGLVLYRYYI